MKPEIGQKLYSFGRGLIELGTVTSVGRKWFYSSNSMRFHIENWQSESGQYQAYTLEGVCRVFGSNYVQQVANEVFRWVDLDDVQSKLDLMYDLTALIEEGIRNDVKKLESVS